MTLRELIQKATNIYFAGMCECGERKFDLDCGDNLAHEPVHESAIKAVRPELLKKLPFYQFSKMVQELRKERGGSKYESEEE